MNLRDHGYGDSPEVTGVPKVLGEAKGNDCPHCGCTQTFLLRVEVVKVKRLKGGSGSGSYIGCPACPWASPMVTVATGKTRDD